MLFDKTHSWVAMVVTLFALAVSLSAGCREHGDAPSVTSVQVPRAIAIATAIDPGRPESDVLRRRREAAKARPTDPHALIRLGWTYVDLARESKDAGFNRLALATAQAIEDIGGDAGESLLLRGQALHALHRFSEAEAVARRLVEDRGLPMDYGLLGDVLLDRGDLSGARTAYQEMLDTKPDAHAYARAATLFHITGESESAKQLMAMAVRAISPRHGAMRAWACSRLAMYFLEDGDTETALAWSEASLRADEASFEAWDARGRIEFGRGNLRSAIESLEKAIAIDRAPEAIRMLGDLRSETGDLEGATALFRELATTRSSTDPRGLALFLAESQERVDDARAIVAAELLERQDARTFDALAWVLRASGDLEGAGSAIEKAVVGSPADPRILFHGGVIAAERGQDAVAVRLLTTASRRRASLLPSEQRELDAFLYETRTTNASS